MTHRHWKALSRACFRGTAFRIVVASLFAAVSLISACQGDSVTGPDKPGVTTPSSPVNVSAFTCQVKLSASSVSCTSADEPTLPSYVIGLAPEQQPDNILIGGQHQNIDIVSSNVTNNGTTHQFAFDVTVKNLRPQPIGTANGTTTDSSLAVAFVSGPTNTGATSGTISVFNATGTAVFTAPGQPYFKYGQMLAQNQVSPAKNWILQYDAGVQSFSFLLLVSASVKFPNGYIDVTAPSDSMFAGTALQMQDSVRDPLGVATADQSETWSLSSTADSAKASINAAGLLTGIAAGNVTVVATQGLKTGSKIIKIKAPATKLAITAHATALPQNGVVFATQPIVQLKDAGNANVTVAGVVIHAALTTGSGALGGTDSAATNANGAATFTNLKITGTTGQKVITYSSGALTMIADTVNLTAGPAANIVVTAASTGVPAGSGLNITANVTDASANPVNAVSVSWTQTSTGTAGTFSPGASTSTNASGVATVTFNTSATVGVSHTVIGTISGPKADTTDVIQTQGPPTAVADSSASNSSPGSTYHATFNTTLNIAAGPGLLANDNLGVPVATLTSFGADSLGGVVTDHAAGSTVSPLPGHADGSLTVNSNGSVAFTPSTGFTGYYVFHYRISNTVGGVPKTSDGLVKIAVGTRPSASNSTYATTLLGNVRINTDTAAGSGVTVTAAGDNPVYTVTGGTGGTATVFANKRFAFTPNAGFTGAASFTFTVKNGFGTTAPATVSMTVGPSVVWFVDASAAGGGDGRRGTPFNCLVGASGCYNGSANLAGHIIYVASGTYAGNGTLALKNTQRVIGQGATGSFSTLAGVTWPADAGAQPIVAGTPPVVSPTAGAGITLATDNQVKGLRVNTPAGAAITGSSVGTLIVANVAVNATGGPALDLTSGTINVVVDSARSTNSSATGINLNSVGGAATVNGGTASAITNPTGSAVSIANSSVAFTFPGTISKTNGANVGINIASNSGGSATFSGPSIVLNTGTSAGVNMTSSNETVSFVDSLKLTTTTGNGVNATGGGTLTIAGTHNAITSVGGIALNVSSTTIGAGGLNFRSISANGGANGIVLISTGSTAGLTVTGDGSTNGSGGTIQNTVGADGAQAGNGIYLSGAKNTNLSWMSIHDHQSNGLYGTGVAGITMNKVRFTGNNGTSNSGTYNESAVNLVDPGSGPMKFTNSIFNGGAMNGVRIENVFGAAATLDSVVFAFDTVTFVQGSTMDVRGTAILLNIFSGSADVRARNNYITYWWGNAIHVLIQQVASGTFRANNNFTDNTNGALAAAGGIWTGGCNLAFNISNNTIRHTNGAAVAADMGPQCFGTVQGTIDSNAIGVSGDPNSGSATGIAIAVGARAGSSIYKISNNVIRQINGSASGAITTNTGDATGFGGSGTANITISGNNIQESGTLVNNAQHGILITHGTSSSGPDQHVGCYDVLNNVITNFISGTAMNRIRVNQRFSTTSRWPGYTGAATGASSTTDLATYLLSRNTASTSTNANSSTGGFTNTIPAGSACTQPSM